MIKKLSYKRHQKQTKIPKSSILSLLKEKRSNLFSISKTKAGEVQSFTEYYRGESKFSSISKNPQNKHSSRKGKSFSFSLKVLSPQLIIGKIVNLIIRDLSETPTLLENNYNDTPKATRNCLIFNHFFVSSTFYFLLVFPSPSFSG